MVQLLKHQSKNWDPIRLSDIAVEGPSNGIFKQRHEFGNGVPIINVADLYSSPRVNFRSLEHVSVSEKELNKFSVKAGDLFFCRSSLKKAGIGWCCYAHKVPEPAVFDCHVMRVHLDPGKADPEFITYYWSHPDMRNEVIRNSHTSTMTTMSQKDLSNVTIPLPPLKEQKRIAAIARKCDRIRRTRRYTQQLSDTYLQSVFLDMFGDPVANSMNWEMSNLGSKITFITSGSRGWAEYYSEKGDIFLRIQNVGRGNLLLDDLAFVQAPETAEGRRTKVKPGDVLISITADLGRTAVIPENFPQAFINQHLCLVRSKNINPIFLAHYLNSEGGKRQFEALDRSGVKSGLNFDDIRSLNLILPPISLQEQYAETVLRYQRISNQRIEATRQAEHLFQTVLHRAFLGEL